MVVSVSIRITVWNGIRFQGIYLRSYRTKPAKRAICLMRNVFVVLYCSDRNNFLAVTYTAALPLACRENGLGNVIEEPPSEQRSQLTYTSKMTTPNRHSFKGMDTCAVKNGCHLVKYSS